MNSKVGDSKYGRIFNFKPKSPHGEARNYVVEVHQFSRSKNGGFPGRQPGHQVNHLISCIIFHRLNFLFNNFVSMNTK